MRRASTMMPKIPSQALAELSRRVFGENGRRILQPPGRTPRQPAKCHTVRDILINVSREANRVVQRACAITVSGTRVIHRGQGEPANTRHSTHDLSPQEMQQVLPEDKSIIARSCSTLNHRSLANNEDEEESQWQRLQEFLKAKPPASRRRQLVSTGRSLAPAPMCPESSSERWLHNCSWQQRVGGRDSQSLIPLDKTSIIARVDGQVATSGDQQEAVEYGGFAEALDSTQQSLQLNRPVGGDVQARSSQGTKVPASNDSPKIYRRSRRRRLPRTVYDPGTEAARPQHASKINALSVVQKLPTVKPAQPPEANGTLQSVAKGMSKPPPLKSPKTLSINLNSDRHRMGRSNSDDDDRVGSEMRAHADSLNLGAICAHRYQHILPTNVSEQNLSLICSDKQLAIASPAKISWQAKATLNDELGNCTKGVNGSSATALPEQYTDTTTREMQQSTHGFDANVSSDFALDVLAPTPRHHFSKDIIKELEKQYQSLGMNERYGPTANSLSILLGQDLKRILKWFDNKRQSERIGLRKRPRDSKSAPTLAVQRKRMCSKLNTTSIPQTPKQEEAHSEPPWSDIDDAMLFQAVKSLGVPIAGLSVQFPQWPDIAKYVPGRTSNQCHERWCYHVDATINRELWSEDKSQEQLHAYNQWNSIWTDTAFQSPVGWTDIACKNQWTQLSTAVDSVVDVPDHNERSEASTATVVADETQLLRTLVHVKSELI